jgi:protease-4
MQVKTNSSLRAHVSLVNDNNAVTPVAPRTLHGTGKCSDCRIALIDVDGVLLNRNVQVLAVNGENPVSIFREKLDAAAADPKVRGLVLRINSPGGGVTACDMMRRDLLDFRQRKSIPIVACLMDVSTGGAYYLATGCDRIVAHPTSLTGGLGVVLNLYNLQDTLAQFNIQPETIKAGQQIDIGTPTAVLTPEAKATLQGIADQFAASFRETIVTARGLPQANAQQLFDGRIVAATQARQLGLVDDLGYLDDALSLTREMAGVDASVVMYRRNNDRAFTPYDITPNLPIQNSIIPVNLPGLNRNQLPTFLYMWQPDPLLEKTGS